MWPQTAKQDGDSVSKQLLCNMWKDRNERPNVGGVSTMSRNGAPSQKGCVVNGQIDYTGYYSVCRRGGAWIRKHRDRAAVVVEQLGGLGQR